MPEETPKAFLAIIDTSTPELAAIAHALRALVQKLDPDMVEIVWPRQRIASYGLGPRKMTEHYVYIAPQKAHVNLGFYRGTGLPDPNALLEGTGKALRHIKLKDSAVAADPALIALVRAATAERRTALAD